MQIKTHAEFMQKRFMQNSNLQELFIKTKNKIRDIATQRLTF